MKHASRNKSLIWVNNVSFLIFIWFLIFVLLTVFTVIIVGCGDSCGVCVEQEKRWSAEAIIPKSSATSGRSSSRSCIGSGPQRFDEMSSRVWKVLDVQWSITRLDTRNPAEWSEYLLATEEFPKGTQSWCTLSKLLSPWISDDLLPRLSFHPYMRVVPVRLSMKLQTCPMMATILGKAGGHWRIDWQQSVQCNQWR